MLFFFFFFLRVGWAWGKRKWNNIQGAEEEQEEEEKEHVAGKIRWTFSLAEGRCKNLRTWVKSKANTNKRKPIFPGIMITRILVIPAFVHSCLNPLFVQFWFMEHLPGARAWSWNWCYKRHRRPCSCTTHIPLVFLGGCQHTVPIWGNVAQVSLLMVFSRPGLCSELH